MTELDDLYQEVILQHSKSPRNFGRLEPHTHAAEGYNPLCGDKCAVTVRLDGDTVADVKFEGAGCAISTASASLMTEAIKGRPVSEAEKLFGVLHGVLVEEQEPDDDLGKLAVLVGVRSFPMRVKCATLAWHTLQAALSGDGDVVSTE